MRLIGLLLVFVSLCAPCHGQQSLTARNVIYITWDGFRWQEFFGGAQELFLSKDAGVADVEGLKKAFWRESEAERREALLPFVWTVMAKQGQVFGDPAAHSLARIENHHKFSYPGYSEMFCGFADDERIASNGKFPNPNVTVLEFLNRRPGFEGKVAGIATWDVFPFILNQPRAGHYVHAGVTPIVGHELSDREQLLNEMIQDTVVLWPNNQIDAIAIQAAREYLVRHQPRVLFIGLGETDEWGHGRRYDRYLHAAHHADDFLRRLWTLLQSMPQYKDQTCLVIAPDHGRGGTIRDWTDHGAKVEGAEQVWMAAMGAGVPSMGVRKDVEVTLSQIAATLARAVGEDFSAASPRSAPPLPGLIASPDR